MAVPMTSLYRASNGDWLCRKAIPADVRDSYKAAFGGSREERFRRPSSLPVNRARQELREWDATISSRIETVRAAKRGDGQSLTRQQCHALSPRRRTKDKAAADAVKDATQQATPSERPSVIIVDILGYGDSDGDETPRRAATTTSASGATAVATIPIAPCRSSVPGRSRRSKDGG